MVVDFLSAVKAQHDVVHLLVGKLDHVVVNEHAVGGERKAEILAVLFLYGASVRHKILDHLPVHKRFAAEKVHFEIAACSAVFHKEIESAFAHFVGHKSAFAVILALGCKAIFAVEIAGVSNVQTHGFEHRVALCKVFYIGLELVF